MIFKVYNAACLDIEHKNRIGWYHVFGSLDLKYPHSSIPGIPYACFELRRIGDELGRKGGNRDSGRPSGTVPMSPI